VTRHDLIIVVPYNPEPIERPVFFNLKERELLENLAKEYDYIIQKNEELGRDCRILAEEVIISDRMIATGSIAGGIAREFNNILIGHKKVVMKIVDMDLPEEIKQEFRDFITCCDSGEKLLRTLIGIAGSSLCELKDVRINEIIEDILILTNSIFEQDKIEIVKNYSHIPEFSGKEQYLREAFVTLLLNSRDLIKSAYERGEITVTTKSEDSHIKVIFTDTGEGISRESLKDIFNPHNIIRGALTKKILPRMGRSMSGIYTIIEEHKGRIEVESRPGEGSNFTIWLPEKSKKGI